jgi:hypothetical protein
MECSEISPIGLCTEVRDKRSGPARRLPETCLAFSKQSAKSNLPN